jgi:hypothetical protein
MIDLVCVSSESVEAPRISSVDSSGRGAPGARCRPWSHHYALAHRLACSLARNPRRRSSHRLDGGHIGGRLRSSRAFCGRLVIQIELEWCGPIIGQQLETLQSICSRRDHLGRILRGLAKAGSGLALLHLAACMITLLRRHRHDGHGAIVGAHVVRYLRCRSQIAEEAQAQPIPLAALAIAFDVVQRVRIEDGQVLQALCLDRRHRPDQLHRKARRRIVLRIQLDVGESLCVFGCDHADIGVAGRTRLYCRLGCSGIFQHHHHLLAREFEHS